MCLTNLPEEKNLRQRRGKGLYLPNNIMLMDMFAATAWQWFAKPGMDSCMEEKKYTAAADYKKRIQETAGALAELLSQSPEYHQLLKAKKLLEADRERAFVLAELRQQQMAMHMASAMGEEMEDAAEVDEMFVMLSQEPVISDYLFAEGRFFRLIADVEDIFSRTLDLGHPAEEDLRPRRYDSTLN